MSGERVLGRAACWICFRGEAVGVMMKETGGDVSADSSQARRSWLMVPMNLPPWLMVAAAFAAGLGLGVGLTLGRRQVAPGQPQRASIAQPMVQSVGGQFRASNLPHGDAVALLKALAKIDADGKQHLAQPESEIELVSQDAKSSGDLAPSTTGPAEDQAPPALAPKPSPGKTRSSAQAPPMALSPLAHPRKSLGLSQSPRTIPGAVPLPPIKTAPPPADELLVPWARPAPKIRHVSNAPAPAANSRRPGRKPQAASRKPVIERIHAGDLVVYRKVRTQPADVSPFERVFGAMIEGRIARAREAAAQPTATESTAAPVSVLDARSERSKSEQAKTKRHRGTILKFELLPTPGAGRQAASPRSNGKSYRVLSSGSPTRNTAAPERERAMKSISRPDNVRLTRDVAF